MAVIGYLQINECRIWENPSYLSFTKSEFTVQGMLINWTVLLTAFFWHITWALYNEKQISISKLSTKPVSNLQLWRHNAGISCTHLSATIAIVCWHISLGENVPKSTHSCFTGETSKTEACFCIYPVFCHNLSAFRVVWKVLRQLVEEIHWAV